MPKHANNQRCDCCQYDGEMSGESAEQAGHTVHSSGRSRQFSDNPQELRSVAPFGPLTVQISNTQVTDAGLVGLGVYGEDDAPTQALGSAHAYRGVILPVSSLAATDSAASIPARCVSNTPPQIQGHAPGGRHLHWLIFGLAMAASAFSLYHMDDPRPEVARLPCLLAMLLIGFALRELIGPEELALMRERSTLPPPIPTEYWDDTIPSASGARLKAAARTRTTSESAPATMRAGGRR